MIKVGFFGTRGHTLKFIELVNSFPESEAVAIWSDDAEKAKITAAEGKISFCNTPEDVLGQCDAVVITTPNAFKKNLVILAANAGKHIFLEKPLAVTHQDAKVAADAVRASGVKFYMSDPFVRKGIVQLKRMIEEGLLGDINGGDVRIAVDRAVVPGHPPVWDMDTALGGILADIGGHGLHIIHYLFGMPDKVYACMETATDGAKDSGMEDNCQLILHYHDRKIITASSSWISGGDSAHTFIYGTKGWVDVQGVPGAPEGTQKLVFHHGKEVTVYDNEDLPSAPTRHVRYFIEMITNDLDNTVIGVDDLSNSGVSIDHAEEYAAIIEASYTSAREGREIRL